MRSSDWSSDVCSSDLSWVGAWHRWEDKTSCAETRGRGTDARIAVGSAGGGGFLLPRGVVRLERAGGDRVEGRGGGAARGMGGERGARSRWLADSGGARAGRRGRRAARGGRTSVGVGKGVEVRVE